MKDSSGQGQATRSEGEMSGYIDKSWDEIFGLEPQDVFALQLKALKNRFDVAMPRIARLRSKAESAGISKINELTDVVPLLFEHTEYKSYPLWLLEKDRFDLLTRWLAGLTSVDLSSVDASRCEGIDDWLELLESKTILEPIHTSGTTGKLSFIPRIGLENDRASKLFLKNFEGFRSEPGVKIGDDGLRLPVVYPSVRSGRYVSQRVFSYLENRVAPTPDQFHTLTSGSLSADMASLSGRVRVAQSRGELNKMQLSDRLKETFRAYLAELERRPDEMAEFFSRIGDELRGKRVLLASQATYLFSAAERGEQLGLSGVFSGDSFGLFGGGRKGTVLPDNWADRVRNFTGITQWKSGYAMSEMIGNAPMCGERHYHFHAAHIPFLLDPRSGQSLSREGRQTGRFAAYDLLAESFWGGFITGDEVTLEWDRPCPCGRKGVYALDSIQRYDEKITGDDKVTCSATVDNTDAALHALFT